MGPWEGEAEDDLWLGSMAACGYSVRMNANVPTAVPAWRPAIPHPTKARHPLPIYVAVGLLYLLLLPEQLSLNLGGLFMPLYRFYIIAAVLYLLFAGLRGKYLFAWPDLFMVLAAAWVWLASYMTSNSVVDAAVQGGAHTVDMAVAYLLARVTIRTPRDLRIFLVLIAPGIGLMSAIVMQEALTHVQILQPWAASLTGRPVNTGYEIRLGFLRGAAGFPHPILAGIFLASFLPIYLMSGLRGWPRIVGVLASLGGFFSLSSAALLGLLAGGALRAYDWLTERVANLNWRMFLLFSGAFYAIVELLTNTGFYGILIRYASLNTASASNRLLIWRFGTENISRHPWFGIGYDDWDRPSWMHWDSFDHFWLIMSLRFGIPETALLLLATLVGLVMITAKSRFMNSADARLMRGVAIAVAVFALGLNSVSIWLSALVWYCMLLGVTVSLGALPVGPARHYRGG